MRWLATTKSHKSMEILIALDLATEKFWMYKTPFKLVSGLSVPNLEVLRGRLCVCINEFIESNSVWVMKEYMLVSS